jgi:hypothetical protein
MRNSLGFTSKEFVEKGAEGYIKGQDKGSDLTIDTGKS